MEIRITDAEALMRAAHLLASLDRARFTEEQLEVIDAAVATRERLIKARDSKLEYLAKYKRTKRASDPMYGRSAKEKEKRKGSEREDVQDHS